MQNWATSVNMGNMSVKSFSGMSTSLLNSTQGKAFKAGTDSFMGKGSALFTNVREKLAGGGAKSTGSR